MRIPELLRSGVILIHFNNLLLWHILLRQVYRILRNHRMMITVQYLHRSICLLVEGVLRPQQYPITPGRNSILFHCVFVGLLLKFVGGVEDNRSLVVGGEVDRTFDVSALAGEFVVFEEAVEKFI